jgi:hypothetical protein
VRANAAHARAGRSFDAEYAASLSADAVPALISVLPSLGGDERCLAERALLRGWTSTAVHDEDWRAWNFARWRARRAMATHRHALSEATCPPPANSMPLNASPPAPEPPPPPAPVKAAIPASTTTDNAHVATPGAGERRLATIETKGAGAAAANAARDAVRDVKARRRKRTRAAARTKTL